MDHAHHMHCTIWSSLDWTEPQSRPRILVLSTTLRALPPCQPNSVFQCTAGMHFGQWPIDWEMTWVFFAPIISQFPLTNVQLQKDLLSQILYHSWYRVHVRNYVGIDPTFFTQVFIWTHNSLLIFFPLPWSINLPKCGLFINHIQ